MYKLFLTLRYMLKRRVAYFAVVAVWLCVAMVLIVNSVMGGFLDMVRNRSRGLLGDIILDNSTLQGFPLYQDFIDELKAKMGDRVVEATPVIYNYGLIRFDDNYTKPVRVVGIRLHEYARVNEFGEGLFYDRYFPGTTTFSDQQMPVTGRDEQGMEVLPEEYERLLAESEKKVFTEKERQRWSRAAGEEYSGPGQFTYMGEPGFRDEPLPGLIAGVDLIAKRGSDGEFNRHYERGAKVILTVLPLSRSGNISGEGPFKLAMRLADDSRTGIYEIDSMCVYVDFEMLQSKLGMAPAELVEGGWSPARASQVQIKIAEGLDSNAVQVEIEQLWKDFAQDHIGQFEWPDTILLRGVDVKTWEQMQQQYIQAIEKERILVTVLFAVISVVAVAMIGCIFYMIVQEKTRDIGIVRSIGATRAGVASIFLTYGAGVGVVGSVLGTILGVVFVWYINDIQDALTWISPTLRVWSPDVYTFDQIPNEVKPIEAAIIVAVAILASMLGSVVAALRAAHVWPVEALRYE